MFFLFTFIIEITCNREFECVSPQKFNEKTKKQILKKEMKRNNIFFNF